MYFMRVNFIIVAIIVATTVFATLKFKNKSIINKAAKAVVNKKLIVPTGLKSYLKKNNFNTNYCFLINMQIASGNNRFFVYNLQKDSVEAAGLVCHGSGKTTTDEIIFSNQPNSYCSSLGKYKIGAAYTGKFGLAYKLYGLDATNSNAFARAVVLHAHSCVPNTEVYPNTICQSWGRPTVAPAFLQILSGYINASKKPILLQISN
jgi:hypothetical protein